MDSFNFRPIGVIHSCYKEKFGIPRQAGLVQAAKASLELHPPYDCPDAVAELRDFSHVWLVFVFHQAMREQWKPTVRPPRLGGNRRVGVFASRSPFRPNPIGLSAVTLEEIRCVRGHCSLILGGVDLLEGTPVLDIKPYVPYADSLVDANGGFAAKAPEAELKVTFSETAARQCRHWEAERYPGLRILIEQVLSTDPRPAYRAGQGGVQTFGMRLYDLDVKWRVQGDDGLEVSGLQLVGKED
ncbi:MAG TPA: tRNA (N6-threonylcarbamoyladenosine(37)-N6)-methyltransferase TrmO [Gammaproteobacteria bacterium]|nr:tRNA (N6-threonylcarbamoyladenosine(37)-N6)-methyltransferase TrmO [Gammaproteobacteria bacterium]